MQCHLKIVITRTGILIIVGVQTSQDLFPFSGSDRSILHRSVPDGVEIMGIMQISIDEVIKTGIIGY